MQYRTHTCGELTSVNIGEQVTLSGWVHSKRKKGKIYFIDMRDRYGVTQIVISEDCPYYNLAGNIKREYVIQVKGIVKERSNKNENIKTGDIELSPNEIIIINESSVIPFRIDDDTTANEEYRMQYRYLDIRRAPVYNNLVLRHKISRTIRSYFDNRGFIEVETPMLVKSTPEGARDFVIPSRIKPGSYYALPQSPQLFKQLLMIGGIDKYYQIARCFRDEDLRADRQPEFTQVDCEMSYMTQEDVMNVLENLIRYIFKETLDITFEKIPRMTYTDAIKDYGSDKPDMRYDLKLIDLTSVISYEPFDNKAIIGIMVSMDIDNRGDMNKLVKHIQKECMLSERLYYINNYDETLISNTKADVTMNIENGNILLLMVGMDYETRILMGRVRLFIINHLKLEPNNKYVPLWVTEFPLLEWNNEENRYQSVHHPFTSPLSEDLEYITSDPIRVRALAYDFVINGIELGGGSIRIHNKEMQHKMFEILGFTNEQINERFGFFIDALEYGTPPHGGFAIGLDRLCSIISGSDTIRDVIAFPKNNKGCDVMTGAPTLL